MTDTAETEAEQRAFFDANIRTPEMEMAEIGANVPSAADLTIDQINPHNPYLFLRTVGKNISHDFGQKTQYISMNLKPRDDTGLSRNMKM